MSDEQPQPAKIEETRKLSTDGDGAAEIETKETTETPATETGDDDGA